MTPELSSNSMSADSWVQLLTGAIEAGTVVSRRAYPDLPRVIPAEALRIALMRQKGSVDPKGLRLYGFVIEGVLDLQRITVAHPLRFFRCVFEKRPVLDYASTRDLAFNTCLVPGLRLNRARIDGTLNLAGIRSSAAIMMTDTRVEGRVLLTSAWLSGATALNIDGGVIEGELRMACVVASGRVEFRGLVVEGKVVLQKSVLRGGGDVALDFSRARFKGGLSGGALRTRGAVRGLYAELFAQIDLEGSVLEANEVALSMDGTRVSGSLRLSRSVLVGQFRAAGADITGQLLMNEVEVRASETAVAVSQARVGAGLFLVGSNIQGTVDLRGSRIEGNLALTQTLFAGRAVDNQLIAIAIDQARVSGGVYADEVVIYGEFRAQNVSVEGTFVVGDTSLSARFDGFVDARFALNLSRARIRSLVFAPASVHGLTDLSRASFDVLELSERPVPVAAAGVHIGDLAGAARKDQKLARAWLEVVPSESFSTQPWHEIAAVFDRAGQPSEARYLRFHAAAKVAWQSTGFARVWRVSYGALVGFGYAPALALIWLAITFLSTWLSISLVDPANFVPSVPAAAASGATLCPDHLSAAVQTRCLSPSYPRFEPWLYALTTISPVGAGGAVAWLPLGGSIAAILAAVRVIGWLLAALLLAGFTGLLRKT